jgi:hypothetical protein
MPSTVPTHPVAVLWLKLWRPDRFDGVALVMGSIAPDVGYTLHGYVTVHSHRWHAPLWWGLPVALVGTRLVRWAAPTVAAHLPAGGWLALRDYGVLGRVRHPLTVTALSAVLGAISHLVWDLFTHPTIHLLRHPSVLGTPWWYLLVRISDALGVVVAVGLAVSVGRARLLCRWHGPQPDMTPRPVLFWSAVGTVFAAGLAALPALPGGVIPDQLVRAMLVGGLALLAGSALVRMRASRAAGRRRDVRARRECREPAARVRVPAPAHRRPRTYRRDAQG